MKPTNTTQTHPEGGSYERAKRGAGGDGPVLVLLHGVGMDATLWRGVVADLTIRGMTRLVAEFLQEMDLNGITLVGNDWAQLLVSEGLHGRVGSGGTGRSVPGVPVATTQIVEAAADDVGLDEQATGPRRGHGPMVPAPQNRSEIRRDLRKYTLGIPPKEVLLEWHE